MSIRCLASRKIHLAHIAKDGEAGLTILVTPSTLSINTSANAVRLVRVDVYRGDSKLTYGDFSCSILSSSAVVTEGLKWDFLTSDGSFYYQLKYTAGNDISISIPFTVTVDGIDYQRSICVQTVKDGEPGNNAVVARVTPEVVELKQGKVDYKAYVDVYDGCDLVPRSEVTYPTLSSDSSRWLIQNVVKWGYGTENGRFYYLFSYIGQTTEVNTDVSISVTYKDKQYPVVIPLRSQSVGKNGVNGKNGVYVPPPMLFADYPVQYKFQCGDLSADPIETRLDIVVILTDAGNLMPYRCTVSYDKTSTSLPPDQDPDHWEACDAGIYRFLATELLWANIGQVNFMSGQAFRVGDESGMCGYFGTPTDGAIFFSGADNVSQATFVVYKDGRIVAKSADIEGRISAATLDLKISTMADGAIPNGSLCYHVNSIRLPSLAVGFVRSIRVYNPKLTRTTPEDLTLIPDNSAVKISADRDFLEASATTRTLPEYGKNGDVYLELLGINTDDFTVWTVNVLSSYT